MNPLPQLAADVLDPTSDLLRQVIDLADRNTDNLGHFPRSAFEREAHKRHIFIVQSEGRLLGYVLYRVAKDRAAIQQLCVAPEARRRGVARILIDKLKAKTKHLDGIVLFCAREYEESCRAWEALGFKPLGEKPGRGESQRPLTRYWFDNGHGDLWSEARAQAQGETLVIVLDANIVYDLQDDDREFAKESRALQADWLQDTISLWVTSELLAEINRGSTKELRQRRMSFAKTLKELPTDEEACERFLEQLKDLGVLHSEKLADVSDAKQLAHAIAGDADVFVTRDVRVLGFADVIETRYSLKVMLPAELIAHLDEVERAHEYAPARLAGTSLKIARLSSEEMQPAIDAFLNTGSGEQKHEFAKRLREVAVQLPSSDVVQIKCPAGLPLGLRAMTLENPSRLEVKVLRLKRSPHQATLRRHMLASALTDAAAKGAGLVEVCDSDQVELVAAAGQELGFVSHRDILSKPSLPGLWTRAQLLAKLEELKQHSRFPELVEGWRRRVAGTEPSSEEDAWIERLIWPGRLAQSCIPSYVIPIKPVFANQLFDVDRAKFLLTAVDPLLLLQCEHVYYRSAQQRIVKAPGRAMWYCSTDKDHDEQEVRGVSAILEVIVRPAKEIFRRFSRLGIYRWTDVREIAGGDPEGEVMAIRFGLTEMARSRISFSALQQAFADQSGTRPPLTMPTLLPTAGFDRLYSTMLGDPG